MDGADQCGYRTPYAVGISSCSQAAGLHDDALAIAEQVDVWSTWAEQTCSARPSNPESCQYQSFLGWLGQNR
jgi:hypothetical protein